MTIDYSNKSEYRVIINIKDNHNTYIYKASDEEVLSDFLYRNLGNALNESTGIPEYVEAASWCYNQYLIGSKEGEYKSEYLHIVYQHITE